MISVVIPLFNKGNYIVETLEALLISDLDRIIEVIVVDDSSTDDSLLKVENVKDDRIKIIKVEKNSGPSHARNLGVSFSKYKYVFFLDADDLVHQDLIRVLVELVNKQCDFACVDIKFTIDSKANLTSNIPQSFSYEVLNKYAYHRLLIRNIFLFTASSTLINKDAFYSIGGFDTSSNFTEDAEFWARLSSSFEGVHVKETLCYYRLVDGSLSSQFLNKMESIPILLSTLQKQYYGEKDNDDLKNAYTYMLRKYYLISKYSNGSLSSEIFSYFIKDIKSFHVKDKLIFYFLRLLPSKLVLYFVKIKRFSRRLTL